MSAGRSTVPARPERPTMLSELSHAGFACEMTHPEGPHDRDQLAKFRAQGRSKTDLDQVEMLLLDADRLRSNINALEREFHDGLLEELRRKLSKTLKPYVRVFHHFYEVILKAWTLPALYRNHHPDAAILAGRLARPYDPELSKNLLTAAFNSDHLTFRAATDDLLDVRPFLLPVKSLFTSKDQAERYFESFTVNQRLEMAKQLITYHSKKYDYCRMCIDEALEKQKYWEQRRALRLQFDQGIVKHPLGR